MSSTAKPHEATALTALTTTATVPRILAADDQQHILEAIELLLKPRGYKVDAARSPELARDALATEQYDAVLIDLNYTRDTTSGREGLDLLSEIVSQDSTLPVIVMTAWVMWNWPLKPCALAPTISSRSPGRTNAYFPLFGRRSNCDVLCSMPNDSQRKIGF